MIRQLQDNPVWRVRLEVCSRVLAATLGGYAFTYAFTAALARLLPLAPVDAVMVASLPSFLVYLAVVLWAFAARSAKRVWLGLLLALPLAAIGFGPQLLQQLGNP